MVASDRSLSDLAESVAEEFEADRDPDGFNELSIVIDNSNRERPTLIVHIDREQAADLADRVRLAGEAIREDEYDAEFYRDLTVRAAESVLSPLGWRRSDVGYLAEREGAALSTY